MIGEWARNGLFREQGFSFERDIYDILTFDRIKRLRIPDKIQLALIFP